MSKSMTHEEKYTPDNLPTWASEWEYDESDADDRGGPIRQIRGQDVRLEGGPDESAPVIYVSTAFVDEHGTIDPENARELAAALVEATDAVARAEHNLPDWAAEWYNAGDPLSPTWGWPIHRFGSDDDVEILKTDDMPVPAIQFGCNVVNTLFFTSADARRIARALLEAADVLDDARGV